MTVKIKGEEYRSTTVCIDSYENGVPCGRLYNRYLPEGKLFCGVTRFLIEMEQLLNDMDFPKAFTEIRHFTPCASNETGSPETEIRMGAAATFTIRVLFRQNASWQGSVVWQEGKQERSFRSALELILLMDNALNFEQAS